MVIEKDPLRTLVIGGAGYIGSYLVPLLSNSNRNVTVLGRRNLEHLSNNRHIKYIQGDFSDLNLLKKLLDFSDEVIHLAYASVPNSSYQNPLDDILKNIPPTVELFSEVSLRRQKLIYISSGGTVYGQSESLPINENHINKPISPYGLTKLTLENYARFYSVTEGLNYCIVRPSNAYGEGQAPFKGQGFIATVIASILKGVPVNIYGSTNVLRDYLYVSDLAYGIFKVLEYGKFGEVYNIGTGIGLSNLDIILKIQNIIGDTAQPAQFNHYPIRPFDVESNYLDCNKIKAHTGWEPKISIDEGLIKTINWLKENYARF